MSIFFKAIMEQFSKTLKFAKTNLETGFTITHVVFEVIIFGIVMSILVGIARGFEKEIATVSMEGVMSSAFGKSLQDTKNQGLSVGRGVKNIYGKFKGK
eukprot:gnl/Chilomastix_cuspidata/13153.p1 GENE.gnl/Chilomastix_cuspidata/13153~~gnl/Chilomastix_cuspidata/13153.p1  ORF type:complete len:112 (-),score=12.89 gnl/Chilomastix_cuspidata/13153:89-385(-)